MAESQTAWGIEMTNSALRAVHLEMGPDQTVQIVDQVQIPHAPALFQSADKEEMARKSIVRLDSALKLKGNIVIGAPSKDVMIRFVDLPSLGDSQIAAQVTKLVAEHIPFDQEEIYYGHQVFRSSDGKTGRLGIFAIRREVLKKHLGFLEKMGLEIRAIQPRTVALFNALNYKALVKDTVVVNMGTTDTTLVICCQDRLWFHNIPIGGDSFTAALMKELKLSHKKAEGLKREAETSKYARQIYNGMRPVFADLVEEIKRAIGFFSSVNKLTPTNMVCEGNAFKLPGLKNFISSNLAIKGVVPELGELGEQGLTAYGLALHGLGLAYIDASLV